MNLTYYIGLLVLFFACKEEKINIEEKIVVYSDKTENIATNFNKYKEILKFHPGLDSLVFYKNGKDIDSLFSYKNGLVFQKIIEFQEDMDLFYIESNHIAHYNNDNFKDIVLTYTHSGTIGRERQILIFDKKTSLFKKFLIPEVDSLGGLHSNLIYLKDENCYVSRGRTGTFEGIIKFQITNDSITLIESCTFDIDSPGYIYTYQEKGKATQKYRVTDDNKTSFGAQKLPSFIKRRIERLYNYYE